MSRREVKCTPDVALRIWKLVVMRGKDDRKLLQYWILVIAVITLYSWVNYQVQFTLVLSAFIRLISSLLLSL